MILPGAEPFIFHSPTARAALLCVHGFTSTPYSMRELGARLAADNLSVYSVLLPGHGTTPFDLEKKTWQDWYKSVQQEFQRLSGLYDQIFLCGQSLGALLVLLLASHVPCSGIISISSGLRLKNRYIALVPIFKSFKRFIDKKNGPDINNPEGKAKEIHYNKMPLQSIHEIQKGLKLLEKRLPSIDAPVLFIHGAEDHVIDVSSMERCYELIGSEIKKKTILDKSCHVATMDNDRERLFEEAGNFIRMLMEKK